MEEVYFEGFHKRQPLVLPLRTLPYEIGQLLSGRGGGEGTQPCKIAKCSIQHGKIEYCNQRQEFPCVKYGRADEYDIFITHRNWKQDFEK